MMKKMLISGFALETQYVRLARKGDPSAFYALFYERMRSLYLVRRTQGKSHAEACGEAERTVTQAYKKFTGFWFGNPQKWFSARYKFKNFNADAAALDVPTGEFAEYEKSIRGALNRAYSERLERGSDGKGNFRRERPHTPYTVAALIILCAAIFLFASQSVITVSFKRWSGEHVLSFPNMAETMWGWSGIVRGDGSGQHNAWPAQQVGDGGDR